MRLDPLNLRASDVPALTDRLVTHFGHRQVDPGGFPAAHGSGTDRFAAVVSADGCDLVITQIEPQPEGGSACPKGFHFGLMQDSRDAIVAKHAVPATAGLEPGGIGDGFEVWGATWTAFCCTPGDGLEIEIDHRTAADLLDAQ